MLTTNPSGQWTPEERLKVIGELTIRVLNERLAGNAHTAVAVIETVHLVAVQKPKMLELNRKQILALP